MFDCIYVEESVREELLVREILDRFPRSTVIDCLHYGEIFNRKRQNFRLQKTSPALILAKKNGVPLLPAPEGYGMGARHNYYFSHMLNCIYDCRYCFLQGMYRSAHTVLFVNYEVFIDAIRNTCRKHRDEPVHLFSGYDGDSLALEPLSGFAGHFIEQLRTVPNAWLELRTKSTQTRQLLDMEPWSQCVVAFSFTPEQVAGALEHGVPPLARRIGAMSRLQQRGWKIGLRFDPLVYTDHFEEQYIGLFEQIFAALDPESVHSISFGPFRMPQEFFRKIASLYPEERLFALPMTRNEGSCSYTAETEKMMRDFCLRSLASRVSTDRIFPCSP